MSADTQKPGDRGEVAAEARSAVVPMDAEREKATRPERIGQLTSKVDDLFPGDQLRPLRTDITDRSFSVPQRGEHHNEGIFMDRHLESILNTLEDIKADRFHEAVPKVVRAWMKEVVRGNERTLGQYAFLHDISKADTLTIKYADGKSIEPTWDEWVALLPQGAQGDPVLMKRFFEEQGIVSISYFQDSKKTQHGHLGAEKLSALREPIGIPQTVLTAIDHHEVAYQFEAVNIKTYERYFGSLADEEIDWILTASYIDTMSSWGREGNPDLFNFLNFANTVRNYRLIRGATILLSSIDGLDADKIQESIKRLRNGTSPLDLSLNILVAQLAQDCQLSHYDKARLTESLQALVVTGRITEAQRDAILTCIDSGTGLMDKKAFRPVIQDLKGANPLVREALASAEIRQGDNRTLRIAIEDATLSRDPAQRKTHVLDYIRRGRLKDSVYILPEVIQAAPYLLESGLIDFGAENYNERKIIDDIIRVSGEVDREVCAYDQQIRALIESKGIRFHPQDYLNRDWYNAFLKDLEAYRGRFNNPNAKHPLASDLPAYQEDCRRKYIVALQKKGFTGSLEDFLRGYETDASSFQIDLPQADLSSDPLKRFVYEKTKGQFFNYPRLQGYRGGVLDEVPSLKNQRKIPGIRVIERDQVPAFHGGVIFDGNFGFDEAGNLLRPEDKMIIDHHDAQDEKLYDTASIMSKRFWAGKVTRRKIQSLLPQMATERRENPISYIDTEGIAHEELFSFTHYRLPTMVNDPDTDALLALWTFRNPKKAEKYNGIFGNISICGDFLIGSQVMEYGATARDYNYIIMNYLRACEEKIREERTQALEATLAEKTRELDSLRTEKEAAERAAEGFLQSDIELSAMTAELASLRENSAIPPREKGPQIAAATRALEAKLKEKAAPECDRRDQARTRFQALNTDVTRLKTEIENKKRTRINPEENERIVSHFMGIIEDIITNPFKYRRFLQQGREAEEATIQQVGQAYREGQIEITPYAEDPEIIRIVPLGAPKLPRYPSVDGLYFFLRKRPDFNQPLIINEEKDSYLIGLNTQDKRVLLKYNFNPLVERLRAREDELIRERLTDKQAALATEADPKKKKPLEKEVADLEGYRVRNQRKQLWRNRNQLAFCFRSFIPHEEFLRMVYEWKQEHDRQQK